MAQKNVTSSRRIVIYISEKSKDTSGLSAMGFSSSGQVDAQPCKLARPQIIVIKYLSHETRILKNSENSHNKVHVNPGQDSGDKKKRDFVFPKLSLFETF